MRFLQRRILVPICAVAALLSGCGDVPFASARADLHARTLAVTMPEHHHRLTPAQRRAFHRWVVWVMYQRWIAWQWMHPHSAYSDATWWRVGICETGGDVHAHDSVYSSVFGVLNGHRGEHGGVWGESDSVWSALRILSGTASYPEELRMAKREANEFGITAWAHHTLVCAGIT